MRLDRTWLAAILVTALGVHAVAFLLYAPGDIYYFVREWYRHLMAHGFSEPIGNYAPPYMYLLWALTSLDGLLWQIVLIKLLSVAGAIWMAFGVGQVLRSMGGQASLALLALALPSVILDVSLLGQADTFWIAPCLLATAAALDGKFARVAAWSGLAFAVKAQAAFFAPFVLYLFVRNRVDWWTWLIAPAVLVAAWLPAWGMGWPLSYLATLYFGQFEWIRNLGDYFVGNGASWWTGFGYIAPQLAFELRWVGIPLVLSGIAFYLTIMPEPTRETVVLAAAISAALVPFLLPLMLDRFFLLADILTFTYALARPSPQSIAAAVLIQVATAMPMFVWAFRGQPWEASASLFAFGAIYFLVRELSAAVTRTYESNNLDRLFSLYSAR